MLGKQKLSHRFYSVAQSAFYCPIHHSSFFAPMV